MYDEHKVYTSVPYDELVERVAEYLEEQCWVVSSRDPDRDWERIGGLERWNVDEGQLLSGEWPSARVIASPARSIADDYGDVSFRITHAHWAEERGLWRYQHVPRVIQDRVPNATSIIVMDSTRRYNLAHHYGRTLADLLHGRNSGHAAHRVYRNDLTSIEDGSLAPGTGSAWDATSAITRAVSSGAPAARIPESAFPENFLWVVDLLHPDTQMCLKTAEYATALPSIGLSAAPAVVEWCKAVENELKRKLLHSIREEYVETISSTHTPIPRLKRLHRHLKDRKSIELGTAAQQLAEARLAACDSDPLAIIVRDRLSRSTMPDLPERLSDLAANFRNPAAHSLVSSDLIDQTRHSVLELLCELGTH